MKKGREKFKWRERRDGLKHEIEREREGEGERVRETERSVHVGI